MEKDRQLEILHAQLNRQEEQLIDQSEKNAELRAALNKVVTLSQELTLPEMP